MRRRLSATLVGKEVHSHHSGHPGWRWTMEQADIDQFIRGGYLGLDMFFVLSGFLITTLLLEEARRRGTVDVVACNHAGERHVGRPAPVGEVTVVAELGRVVLGLANGPGDGLEAVSGGRRPDVAETALQDAVSIVRRMWDTSEPPIHHHGHHRVAGAEPGPMPAHDIPVWLRGDEPSTIELAGRVADGWMGHLGSGGPDQLIQGLRMLDQQAAERVAAEAAT